MFELLLMMFCLIVFVCWFSIIVLAMYILSFSYRCLWCLVVCLICLLFGVGLLLIGDAGSHVCVRCCPLVVVALCLCLFVVVV